MPVGLGPFAHGHRGQEVGIMMAPQVQRRDVAAAFGATLRAIRQERGLSQDELSERADMDRAYPSLLERGQRHPTLLMLRLATALDIKPERFVTDTVARLEGERRTDIALERRHAPR